MTRAQTLSTQVIDSVSDSFEKLCPNPDPQPTLLAECKDTISLHILNLENYALKLEKMQQRLLFQLEMMWEMADPDADIEFEIGAAELEQNRDEAHQLIVECKAWVKETKS